MSNDKAPTPTTEATSTPTPNGPPQVDKKWPWNTLDPALQRAAWIVAIVTGVTVLWSHYGPPSGELFSITVALAATAGVTYALFTRKNWLTNWHDQHFIIFQMLIANWQLGFYVRQTQENATERVVSLAILWGVVFLGWLFLSIAAAYQRHRLFMSYLNSLAEGMMAVFKRHEDFISLHKGTIGNVESIISTQSKSTEIGRDVVGNIGDLTTSLAALTDRFAELTDRLESLEDQQAKKKGKR